MNRGIEISSNTQMAIIHHIFKGIDLSLYDWTSENYEAYSKMTAEGYDIRFSPPIISGEDFQKAVYSGPEYTIDFAELKGFTNGGKICAVDSYEDFINSDCQIMILINDMRFFEAYLKDPVLLEKVYNNALAFGDYSDLEYKTDEDDCRTVMHVW